VATDTAGNVYVADSGNSAIRKITPAGVVTTLAGGTSGSADGTGAAASFSDPKGVAVDGSGNVFVADTDNHTIREITPAGVVTTFAGMAGMQGSSDGTGASARFYRPIGVAVDRLGDLYVADTGNGTIRKITPAGVVTTIVGQVGVEGFAPGPLPGVLNAPQSVTLFGTTLYTTTNNAIVQVSNVP
jgi:sugar lactone lactonase YvrE